MKFPVLQIQSAQGPFFYKEDHRGIPFAGKALPLGFQTFNVMDEKGNVIGTIYVPKSFTIVKG